MRKIIGLCLAAAALAGCNQTQPAATSGPASASAAPDVPDASAAAQIMADEAKAMQATPGIATRKGDSVTISYNGKPVARFTAGHAAWSFKGMIKVTIDNGSQQTLAEVYRDQGAIGFTGIVLEDGRLVMLDDTVIRSPDGRLLASGYGDSRYTANLQTVVWGNSPTPLHVKFAANCRPLAWQGNKHFTAACVRSEDHSLVSIATVTRQNDDSWLFTETRQLKSGKAADFAKLKLRTETVFPVRMPDTTDFGQIDGYTRLGD